MAVRPANIDLDRDAGELRIRWQDGRNCVYPLSALREACPCAECRGGHEFMGREHDPANILVLKPKRTYGVQSVDLVGNYALQFLWDDQHDAGIYTWDYLSRLCPDDQSDGGDAEQHG